MPNYSPLVLIRKLNLKWLSVVVTVLFLQGKKFKLMDSSFSTPEVSLDAAAVLKYSDQRCSCCSTEIQEITTVAVEDNTESQEIPATSSVYPWKNLIHLLHVGGKN